MSKRRSGYGVIISVHDSYLEHLTLRGAECTRHSGDSVKSSVRQALAESYVAAIAIAALLLSSIDEGFRALWPIISRAARYVFTAVAIFDVPYLSPTLNVMDRLTLIETSTYLYGSVVSLFAAWLLSRWVSGVGPFCYLIECKNRFTERKHA